jgi:hypothetical protein
VFSRRFRDFIDFYLGGCKTRSGPSGTGKDCILPFKHNGKTFTGCPVDPVDPTKRWCSTKVDSTGNHVKGQNEFGHCATNCPFYIEDTVPNTRPTIPRSQ